MDIQLKKLSRLEILELMLAQCSDMEEMETQLLTVRKENEDYRLMIQNLKDSLSFNAGLLKEQEKQISVLRAEYEEKLKSADGSKADPVLLEQAKKLDVECKRLGNESAELRSLNEKLHSENEELRNALAQSADKPLSDLSETEVICQELLSKTNARCKQLLDETERLCRFRLLDLNEDVKKLVEIILSRRETYERLFGREQSK